MPLAHGERRRTTLWECGPASVRTIRQAPCAVVSKNGGECMGTLITVLVIVVIVVVILAVLRKL